MEHGDLVDKILREIASARARITSSYTRLWPDKQPQDEQSDAGTRNEQAADDSQQRSADDPPLIP